MEKVADAWSQEMRRGYAKFIVLTILSNTSLTGYDIIKEFHVKTLGFWRLTTGGVYPILQELEKKEYITGEWRSRGRRKRKIYKITDEGKQLLRTVVQKQQRISKTMDGLIREYAQDILETEFPPTLLHPPFDFLTMIEQFKKKPVDEQIRILNEARDRMQNLIRRIDERLAQIEAE